MNTIELMDGSVSSFSKTDRAIYEAIRKFPDMFAASSVTEIANGGGFSKPALTRFAQRLGFGGFVEFQYQFAQDLEERRQRSDAPTSAEVYGGLLKLVEERLDREQLLSLLERMRASRHVYLMGYNLSRIPAEELNIALQFDSTIHASYPQIDVSQRFVEDDLLIVYSAVSGDSLKGLMHEFKIGRNAKPYMVLVTTNSKHPLRRNFDEVIVLPTANVATSDRTVLADTFAFLMFNDVLTSLLPAAR
ncbi:MAG: MurR/RpiR family transcriptional regulator [Atopobiaceae bacterium]|nr:MurR/RpiR family transcriptional regulator [Atopobiaceae bacterium]